LRGFPLSSAYESLYDSHQPRAFSKAMAVSVTIIRYARLVVAQRWWPVGAAELGLRIPSTGVLAEMDRAVRRYATKSIVARPALIARGCWDPLLIADGSHAAVAKPDARFLGEAEVADIGSAARQWPAGCPKDARKRVTALVRDDHLDLAASKLVDVVARDAVRSAACGITEPNTGRGDHCGCNRCRGRRGQPRRICARQHVQSG